MTSLAPLTPSDVDPSILAGAKVVIAGKCCLGMFRQELVRVIEAGGGVISELLTAKTASFIVTPDWGDEFPERIRNSVKFQTALHIGVPVLRDSLLEHVLRRRVSLNDAIQARRNNTDRALIAASDAKATREHGLRTAFQAMPAARFALTF